MKTPRKKLILAAATTLLVLLLPGCGKETPEVQNDEGGSSPAQPQFQEVLSLWQSGDKESAAESFLKVNWQNPELFAGTSILNLSEAEFAKMPAAKRDEIKEKAMELVGTIRQLAKHVMESGKKSLEAKDYDAAEKQFNGALECGLALSRAEGLALVKMVGSTIRGAALKELTRLYAETGEQTKLKTVQEKLSQL